LASAPSYATRVQPPGAFVIVCISRHAVARTGMGPRRRGHRRADLSLGTAQWAQTPPLDDDRSGSPPDNEDPAKQLRAPLGFRTAPTARKFLRLP
jgi:hypothetical protein